MKLSYLEDFDSKIPAIQVLHALGWQYLSRDEALNLRNGRLDQVVLTGILTPWLEKHNRIEVKGESHLFSEANIGEAIRRLTDEPFDGLIRTNEKLYHLLTLGTSLDQTIGGDRKGRSLQYVDWKNPARNVYHVSDEFEVERYKSHEKARPDLVLFVNGIPMVVIECKRRDKDQQAGQKQIDVAIEQMLRNQKSEYIPHLFTFAQLLIGTSVNEIRYGTVGTPRKFWSVWKEEGDFENAVHLAANTPLPDAVANKIFAPRDEKQSPAYREARDYFAALVGGRRPAVDNAGSHPVGAAAPGCACWSWFTATWSSMRGVRKIARYQQYFAVRETVARVAAAGAEGKRQGGVIWHTTGSGKSLTMVMLAKALALHPPSRTRGSSSSPTASTSTTRSGNTFRGLRQDGRQSRPPAKT